MTFCNHKPDFDQYMNIKCTKCYRIFARNQPDIPDYVAHRTDADRDV